MNYSELIERLRKETPDYCPSEAADAIESMQAEVLRMKVIEESALKVCAELDSIVMVMPYDYLDPPDGGNVPMSEQVSRMWSDVKELRSELAKYRDAPVVAWCHYDYAENTADYLQHFKDTYASIPLIVKPGEEK